MTQHEYETAVANSSLPLRLKKELKTKKPLLDFTESELIAVYDKNATTGLLFFDSKEVLPFSLAKIKSSNSGRLKPMTCDFCVTWLPGSKVAQITFQNRQSKTTTHTFYCCMNLRCSDNVRGKTVEAIESRTQVKEDIDTLGRVQRLHVRFSNIVRIVNGS